MTEVPMYYEYNSLSTRNQGIIKQSNKCAAILEKDHLYLISASIYLVSDNDTSTDKLGRGLFVKAYNSLTSNSASIEIGSHIEYSYGAKTNTYAGSVCIPFFLYKATNYNYIKLFARISSGGSYYPSNEMTQMIIIPLS